MPPEGEPTDQSELIVLPQMREMPIPGSAFGRKRGEPVFIPKQANWPFWKSVDRVSLIDAVILSVDLDPETEPRNIATGNAKYQLLKTSLMMIDATSWQRLENRARIALSSIGATLRLETQGYELSELVLLPVFGDWAARKGLQLPGPFPRQHASSASGAAGWPWGAFETPLLKELSAAVNHFWMDYRPESAPTKKQVVDWLQKRGRTKREALAIAQIIRPPDLPDGPRAKRDKRKG